MAYLGNDLQVAFPVYRNIDDISGSFNSSTTSFPLRVSGVAPVPAPLYSQQCLISVGGVVQRPDDSGSEGFRLSGGNIIFASAPTTGADFFGVILAGADYINAGGNFPSGTAAVPSITFNDDLDTGIYNSGINQVSITTGGSERLRIDSAGQIESVSLGTAAAPAFSFTTDPNTGIYSPGADQVAISTGGSGRLFVDASGNVGIADSTPQRDAGTTSLAIGDGSKSASVDLYGTVKNYAIYNGGSGQLGVFDLSASTERITLTSAGLVGVGTSSPSYTLDVTGTHRNSGIYFNQNDTPQGTAGTITRHSVVGLTTRGITGSVFDWSVYSAGGTALISNGTGTNNVTFPGGNVAFTGGSVGIGSTTPRALLDVGGSAAFNAGTYQAPKFAVSNGYIGIKSDAADGVSRLTLIGDSATGDATIDWGGNTNANLIFSNNGSNKARIDSSGRLLVGTSSTSSASALVVQNNSSGNGVGVVRINYSTDSPGANDTLGIVSFGDNTHGEYTSVAGLRDGGTWSSTSKPTRLTFSTTADGASSPTERVRIDNKGFLKASNNATFTVGDTHVFNTNLVNAWTLTVESSSSSGNVNGILTRFTGYSPNNTSQMFMVCADTTADRVQLRSNGGIANFQANNVNLSDRNAKKDITPAADTWDCIKEWEIVNYRYKDQPDGADLNLGVIAQQVAESCPEVITVFEEAKDDQPEKLGVKEQQMYWMAIKALQEAMSRIETLEAEVAALKAS